MLIDTHCHLYDERLQEDFPDVLSRALAADVGRIVVPGVDLRTSVSAIELAEVHAGLYAAVGLHPESLDHDPDETLSRLDSLLSHPKVVAVGEVGLDYYWDVAPREVQRDAFRRQIDIARRARVPLIVHNRDATADVIEILEETCKDGPGGVMHCFTGSYETAKRCMELGFYLSFGGPVTFKNARNVAEVASRIPDEWLLVETDSPYLTPHPFRGQRNEPARVQLVAEKLSELRGQSPAEVARVTTQNALRLFARMDASR